MKNTSIFSTGWNPASCSVSKWLAFKISFLLLLLVPDWTRAVSEIISRNICDFFLMTPVYWSRKMTALWKCPEENAERWITITKWRLQKNVCLKISRKKHISAWSLFCWKLLRTQKPENRCCRITHSMHFGIMSMLIAFQGKRSASLQRERSRRNFFLLIRNIKLLQGAFRFFFGWLK